LKAYSTQRAALASQLRKLYGGVVARDYLFEHNGAHISVTAIDVICNHEYVSLGSMKLGGHH
jgi:hypothetical protein